MRYVWRSWRPKTTNCGTLYGKRPAAGRKVGCRDRHQQHHRSHTMMPKIVQINQKRSWVASDNLLVLLREKDIDKNPGRDGFFTNKINFQNTCNSKFEKRGSGSCQNNDPGESLFDYIINRNITICSKGSTLTFVFPSSEKHPGGRRSLISQVQLTTCYRKKIDEFLRVTLFRTTESSIQSK